MTMQKHAKKGHLFEICAFMPFLIKPSYHNYKRHISSHHPHIRQYPHNRQTQLVPMYNT